MARSHSTDRSGYQFDHATKSAVWNKASTIPGYSKDERRRDTCGSEIQWAEYGNTNSSYGWEIDHIYPVSKGGSDDISNLQALQWELNRKKSDQVNWLCPV